MKMASSINHSNQRYSLFILGTLGSGSADVPRTSQLNQLIYSDVFSCEVRGTSADPDPSVPRIKNGYLLLE